MDGFNMEGMSTQAQQIWSMLDDMAQNDPTAYRKFIDKQLKDGKEEMALPEPHMCIQVSLLSKPKGALYINFCSWKRIPEPKSSQDAVPVSGTAITHEKDETGKYSLTSVAFNPKVLQEYGREAKNPVDADTLVQLALDYIEHEQKVQISRSYTLLPEDVTHKGDLALIQMSLTKLLRNKNGNKDGDHQRDINHLEKKFGMSVPNDDSLLSQLSNISVDDSSSGGDKSSNGAPNIDIFNTHQKNLSKSSKKGLIEELGSTRLPAPKYSMEKADLDSGTGYILSVNLPGVKGVSECELDISAVEVELTVPGVYELKLKLPSPIDSDLAMAKFSKKLSTLTLSMPSKS